MEELGATLARPALRVCVDQMNVPRSRSRGSSFWWDPECEAGFGRRGEQVFLLTFCRRERIVIHTGIL
jgi:hypothetical protein